MQQQQVDGSYQELWPKNDSWNKIQVLTDNTRSLLGIDSNSVPDDAFLALFIGVGNYGYKVKVTYPDGTPAANCTISGLTAISGQSLITNSQGYCLALSTSTTPTITAISSYEDLDSSSIQVNSTGTVTSVDITLKKKKSYVLYTSSTNIKLSPMVSTIDIGGIGGGCVGEGEPGGKAATGGYSKGVAINSSNSLSITIGSASTSTTATSTFYSIDGITQSFQTVKIGVEGGAAGTPEKSDNNHGSPGKAGWYMFDDSSYPAVGASGGRGVYLGPAYFGYTAYSVAGGNPGGGGRSGEITSWSSSTITGDIGGDATGYGSGGGGDCSCYYTSSKASRDARPRAGKQGCVIIVYHYKN